LPNRRTTESTPSRLAALLVFLLAGIVLVAHAFYYYPFISDDALISLRYVERFLDGKGLTWTDGRPVEGYSNLLWVLLTAALGVTGMDLVVAVRILGVLASAGALAAIVYAAFRFTARPLLPAVAGCSVWVASAACGAWAMAGLEMPLVACLLAWALVWTFDLAGRSDAGLGAQLRLGACLGGLALARPDGFLFTVVIAAWFLIRGRLQRRAFVTAAGIVLVPVLLFAAQLAFRRAYYGEWLPNTAYAKINPSGKTLVNGLAYLWKGLSSLRPAGELGVAALVALCLKRRPWGSLLALVASTWIVYVAAVGGDSFPAARMLVPVVIVFAFAAIAVAAWARDAWPATFQRRAGVAAAIALAWFVLTQVRHPFNVRAKDEVWEWNGKGVGEALGRGFAAEQPLLAVTAAGAVPYWSKLPGLDMLGLNDHHIARAPVPGGGWIGHEKGDPAYVLDRKPDLILFGTPGGSDPTGMYASLMEMPVFRAQYDKCAFAARSPSGWFMSRIWANRYSPRIGIRSTDRRIAVPPYLLSITGRAAAQFDARDGFFVVAAAEEPVGIGNLQLGAGRWQVVAPAGPFEVRVRDAHDDAFVPVAEGVPPVVDIPRTGPYHVLIRPTGEPRPVYGLVLQRL
jgi:hypothetical protein